MGSATLSIFCQLRMILKMSWKISLEYPKMSEGNDKIGLW
jgi:hypothetical protein